MAWFWTLLVLQSHGVFCCRELLFFEAVFTGISSSSRRHQFCEQPQATESVDKCCFSRFPDDTLGSFFAWFWTLLVLPSHGVLLPGAAFFEAVLPASAAAAAATSSASSRRQTEIFRPCSSFRAMVFCCRGLLFSKLFYRHQQQQPQATESLDKCCFSRSF